MLLPTMVILFRRPTRDDKLGLAIVEEGVTGCDEAGGIPAAGEFVVDRILFDPTEEKHE